MRERVGMPSSMTDFRAAIENFSASQAKVYQAQPSRIARDSTAARRSQKDHAGRWFFELVQNSEDAGAASIEVRVTSCAVYVADNGGGFRSEAVPSISGTDFTDKPMGAIGRKGVGFKAVYEITAAPQLFTSRDQGLEFNPDRARDWFQRNGLSISDDEMPYQWIPFFVSRAHAERDDPVLRELSGFATVVRLPLRSSSHYDSVRAHLLAWPSYALLPFRHLTGLKVSGQDTSFDVHVVREDPLWTLRDSRVPGESKWKAVTRTLSPPADRLADMDADDRRRCQDGVRFLVAAPANSAGNVKPAADFLPVHVFYPTTEQSPVRLLLHAEFLVKSDRTALIPIEKSLFNTWVADALAGLVVEFVNGCFDPSAPAAQLELLLPVASVENLASANVIWKMIQKSAAMRLLLPDANGQPRLCLNEARLLSVTVNSTVAREILAGTITGAALLHASTDGDSQAKKALRELGCQSITDYGLLDDIRQNANSNREDHK